MVFKELFHKQTKKKKKRIHISQPSSLAIKHKSQVKRKVPQRMTHERFQDLFPSQSVTVAFVHLRCRDYLWDLWREESRKSLKISKIHGKYLKSMENIQKSWKTYENQPLAVNCSLKIYCKISNHNCCLITFQYIQVIKSNAQRQRLIFIAIVD